MLLKPQKEGRKERQEGGREGRKPNQIDTVLSLLLDEGVEA